MSEPERAGKPVISERIAVGRSSQQVYEYFLDDRQGLDGHVVVGVRRMGIPLPVDAGDVKRDPGQSRSVFWQWFACDRIASTSVAVSIPVAGSSL